MTDRPAAPPTDDALEARLRAAAGSLPVPDLTELLERLSQIGRAHV